jgi:hypothetical protein
MRKGKFYTVGKKYIYLFLLLILFVVVFYLYKRQTLPKNQLSYVNSQYGFEVRFPSNIKTYEKVEYPWPSHEKAYNTLIDINFATSKGAFTGGDAAYLSEDNVVKIGNILNIGVYDISLCNDKNSDDAEKTFCDKYVFAKEKSGANVGSWPSGYWARGDKYVLFMEESPETYSKIGETARNYNSKVYESYKTIGDRFVILFLK